MSKLKTLRKPCALLLSMLLIVTLIPTFAIAGENADPEADHIAAPDTAIDAPNANMQSQVSVESLVDKLTVPDDLKIPPLTSATMQAIIGNILASQNNFPEQIIVKFGGDDGDYYWRVIGGDIGGKSGGVYPTPGSLTLAADTRSAWGASQFYPDYNDNTYNNYGISTLKTKMESIFSSDLSGNANINGRDLKLRSGSINTGSSIDNDGDGENVTDATVWPLSIDEYESLSVANQAYGASYYWLRSAWGSTGPDATSWAGPSDGGSATIAFVDSDLGVRPALSVQLTDTTLNLASDIFTSDATAVSGFKAASGANAFSANVVATMDTEDTELPTKWAFSVDPSAAYDDEIRTLNFTVAPTGYGGGAATANDYLAVWLVNTTTEDIYYAKVAVDSGWNAAASIPIPTTDIPGGSYTLYIGAERDTAVSGGRKDGVDCLIGQIQQYDAQNNPLTVPPSTDARLITVAGIKPTWSGGDGVGAADNPYTTATINVAATKDKIELSDIVTAPFANAQMYTSSTFSEGSTTSAFTLNGGNNDIYIKVTAEDTTALHYKVTVNRPVAYTVTQLGGNDEILDTTGMAIEFSATAPGLTASDITFESVGNGGFAAKSTANDVLTTTDGGKTYTLALESVTTPGDINVAIGDFNAGTVAVQGSPQPVAVYQKATRSLAITAPEFADATYGYAQPAAQLITITNSGNRPATISNVTVSDNAETGTPDFDIITGADSTVSARNGETDGENTSWKVQPKANLSAGEHTATITVEYDGTSGNTATDTVSFTVEKADQPYTAPTNLTATYGDTLADVTSQLNSPHPANGSFSWDTARNAENTPVGDAGNNTFYVTFTPNDTDNYNTINGIEVTIEVDPAPKKLPEDDNIYKVLKNFGKWTGSGSLVARIDADYNKFVALYYGGAQVDRSNYAVTAGSTVITLPEHYLKAFPSGTHTFAVEFSDGYSAEIVLEIDLTGATSKTGDSSKTGDDFAIGLYIAALLLAAAGLAICGTARRRLRRHRAKRI
ncbi:MAG: cadherin-like beta sandwich domain-containing protein [Clostridiales Family XIII bacterium]|nr:cadherin-like beta sandwich domain-containing protein [Clostridiales Family XIII bacterium]